uniref:hypothetical protein n=1 Tax=Salmonella enterica TaxID=28901 RepID=UPI00398C65C1
LASTSSTKLTQVVSVASRVAMIDREKDTKRPIQRWCRGRNNRPWRVGETGAGETAIGEGVAWSIVRGDGRGGVLVGNGEGAFFEGGVEKDGDAIGGVFRIDIQSPYHA